MHATRAYISCDRCAGRALAIKVLPVTSPVAHKVGGLAKVRVTMLCAFEQSGVLRAVSERHRRLDQRETCLLSERSYAQWVGCRVVTFPLPLGVGAMDQLPRGERPDRRVPRDLSEEGERDTSVPKLKSRCIRLDGSLRVHVHSVR
jgi:hypothetical protein